MTEGFEVLVQLVIAAITTSPSRSRSEAVAQASGKSSRKVAGTALKATRSCGRRGPDALGSTVATSISTTCANSGSSLPASAHTPCARA
jgi:hypothetical protein